MATRLSAYRPCEPASLERRGPRRRPVLVTPATLDPLGPAPQAAELTDLSAYGCRLETAAGCRRGERVWLGLSGALPVPATVVWAEDGAAGCRFDEPIGRELVRALTIGDG